MPSTLYRFETANLVITAKRHDEDCDPADSFDDPRDVAAVRNGDVDWFGVVIEVKHKATGAELGGDSLWGCAYTRASDFVEGHRDPNPLNRNCSIYRAKHPNSVICHYFPDMIREACREARKSLATIRSLPVRVAA